MNNTASVLVLAFLAVTFIMSAHDKIFHWNDNMAWLKPHFEKTILKNFVPLTTGILLAFELIAGIFCLVGIIELYINGGRMFGFYGAVFSCISLLLCFLVNDWLKIMMEQERSLFILLWLFWQFIG